VLYAAGKTQTVRERIMAPVKKKSGHLSVMLYNGGRRQRMHVHRMVALAFIGRQPSELHEVAHNDGRPANNCATNLRWATRADNHADKIAHGTHNRGERHPLSKLSDEQVRAIRSSDMSNKCIACSFGISPQHAWAIRTNNARSHA
jgi:hypothetical protein